MKCFNKIEQSKSDQVKNRLSSWISKSGFTYRAEVESDPSFPFRDDEVTQRLRHLVFAMNKKYLKSSFPKWAPENRFYIMGFQEGDKILGNIHYHLLIHVPSTLHKISAFQQRFLDMGTVLMMEWNKLRQFDENLETGKTRRNKYKYQYDKFAIRGLDTEDIGRFPFQVEKIRSSKGSGIYASKKFDAGKRKSRDASKKFDADSHDAEEFFVVGLDDYTNPTLKERRKELKKHRKQLPSAW